MIDPAEVASMDRGLADALRSFPHVLDGLRRSYEELEARAAHVEDELCLANRELEERLRELDGLRGHLEAVLESLPNGVVVRDARGQVARANRSALEILGVTAEELIGQDGHPALAGPEADGEDRELTRGDGSRLVLASRYSDVCLSDGTLDGSVEILDERTERAEMIERLHAADKMASLGTMAAGIAHEIRNPLNAVKGFASLLLRKRPEEHELERWCKLIVDGTAEADAIIENMLSLASPERLRREPIDGEELLEEVARLALAECADPTGVSLRTYADGPSFHGDRIKLRQAIRNLVANAIQAQPDAPHVEVTLTVEDDEVLVRVLDAGPGVPAALRARVFDPFYTERADGTGLGLSLVAAITRLHGGSVRVSPEPSSLGGAEFLIRFPLQPVDGPAVH